MNGMIFQHNVFYMKRTDDRPARRALPRQREARAHRRVLPRERAAARAPRRLRRARQALPTRTACATRCASRPTAFRRLAGAAPHRHAAARDTDRGERVRLRAGRAGRARPAAATASTRSRDDRRARRLRRLRRRTRRRRDLHAGVPRRARAATTATCGSPTRSARRRRNRAAPHDGVTGLGADLNQVRDAFERFDLLDERVHFLQGDLDATLPDAPIERSRCCTSARRSVRRSRPCSSSCTRGSRPAAVIVVDDAGTPETARGGRRVPRRARHHGRRASASAPRDAAGARRERRGGPRGDAVDRRRGRRRRSRAPLALPAVTEVVRPLGRDRRLQHAARSGALACTRSRVRTSAASRTSTTR